MKENIAVRKTRFASCTYKSSSWLQSEYENSFQMALCAAEKKNTCCSLAIPAPGFAQYLSCSLPNTKHVYILPV